MLLNRKFTLPLIALTVMIIGMGMSDTTAESAISIEMEAQPDHYIYASPVPFNVTVNVTGFTSQFNATTRLYINDDLWRADTVNITENGTTELTWWFYPMFNGSLEIKADINATLPGTPLFETITTATVSIPVHKSYPEDYAIYEASLGWGFGFYGQGSGYKYGDITGDGNKEVVYQTSSNWVEAISWKNGYPEVVWRSAPLGSSYSIYLYDVSGDGVLDVITGGYDFVHIFDVKNSEYLWDVYTPRTYNYGLWTGDYDGNGHLDLLVGDVNGNITCYNLTSKELAWEVSRPETVAWDLTVFDTDGDGTNELVTIMKITYSQGGPYGGRVYVIDLTTFEDEWNLELPGHVANNFITYDIDSDGILDLIAGDHYGKVKCVNITGRSILWDTYDMGAFSYGVNVSDIDRDGTPEMIVGTEAGLHLYYLNNGSEIRKNTSMPKGSSSFIVEDLDGDNFPDILVARSTFHLFDAINLTEKAVYGYSSKHPWGISTYNAANGTFVYTSIDGYIVMFDNLGRHLYNISTGQSLTWGVAVLDHDADGIPDVLYGDTDGKLTILSGANWTEIWSYTGSGAAIQDVKLVDIDGDGHDDIFFGGYNKVLLLRGPDYALNWSVVPRSTHSDSDFFDYDGDGWKDIAMVTEWGHIEIRSGYNGSRIWGYHYLRNMTGVTTDRIFGVKYWNNSGHHTLIVPSYYGESIVFINLTDNSNVTIPLPGELAFGAFIYDVDVDGMDELVVTTVSGHIYSFDLLSRVQEWVGIPHMSGGQGAYDSVFIGNIDSDEYVEMVAGGYGDVVILEFIHNLAPVIHNISYYEADHGSYWIMHNTSDDSGQLHHILLEYGDGTNFTWDYTLDVDHTIQFHTYNNPGNHTVNLTVWDFEGRSDTASIVINVENARPTMEIDAANLYNKTWEFILNISDPDGDAFIIYFGEFDDVGIANFTKILTTTYTLSGWHYIRIRALDEYGADTVINVSFLVNNSDPVAVFNLTPATAHTFENITFSSLSVDDTGIELYNWSLGGGEYSNLKDPVIMYTIPGNYSINLTVTDIEGNTSTVSGNITILNRVPAGKVTWSAQEYTVAFIAHMSDLDGTITGYAWEFGDGETGTGLSPTHTYTSRGNYTVNLTVTDDMGGKGHFVTNVSTENMAPLVDVTASLVINKTIEVSVNVLEPEGDSYSVLVEYGDANTSTALDSSHTYKVAGTYTITATATDVNGNSRQDTTTITVLNIAPTAFFTLSPADAKATEDITFTSHSWDDDSVVKYIWEFDEGTYAGTAIVVHAFDEPGNHTITFTVWDEEGLSDDVSITIIVANNPPVAVAGEDISVEAGEAVTLDGTDSFDLDGTVVSHSWTSDDYDISSDTAIYTLSSLPAGTYTLILTVTDNLGATDTDTRVITVEGDGGSIPGFELILAVMALAFAIVIKPRKYGIRGYQ